MTDLQKNISHINDSLRSYKKEDFLFSLHTIAVSIGMAEISKRTGLSREGLYKILDPSGNPRLEVLINILNSIGLCLQVIDRAEFSLKNDVFLHTRINSFAQKLPSISKYWHPNKNGNLTANDITIGSRKKIWWLCPHNKHEWQETPISLVKRRKDDLYKLNIFEESYIEELSKGICQKC